MYCLAYRRTLNIGDAFQTLALARLFDRPLRGVYRHALPDFKGDGSPFIVNGFLWELTPTIDYNFVFAGVYVGGKVDNHVQWFKRSGSVVGCRDSATKEMLEGKGIRCDLTLCATLTFDRWTGARSGIYNIDAHLAPGERLTNLLDPEMSWADQWRYAIERLELMRRAELVYTNRLHVALPCLAFGTPVIITSDRRDKAFQPKRLAALSDVGFKYDVPNAIDVTPFAERYRAYLSSALGLDVRPRYDLADVACPLIA